MEAAFPQLLEKHLRGKNPGHNTQPVVYNLAVDGYSTEQEIRMLELSGLGLKPDLVIINYLLNDPDVQDGGLSRYFTSRLELLHLADQAIKKISYILKGNSYPDEYHQRIHIYYQDRIREDFRRLGSISRADNVPILVAVTPVFKFRAGDPYEWQNIHDSIEDLCRMNGLDFIDLYRSFQGKDSSEFSFNMWHPDTAGHAVIAEALADYLKGFEWNRQ
jgi:lysophospholipase L1-like esterase